MLDSSEVRQIARSKQHPKRVNKEIADIKSLSKEITTKSAEPMARHNVAQVLWTEHETKRAKNLQRLNIELEKLAITDSLTDVYSRRFFFGNNEQDPNSHGEMRRIFLEAERSGNDLSIIILDGDDFKKVNDNFSHLVGDGVLKQLAVIIKSTARESDLVGRYGGEEFIIVLQDTSLENARLLAKRINEAVKNSELPNKLTISAGVASYVPNAIGDDIMNEKDLINQADEALYKAKNTGKDRVIVYGDDEFNKPIKK